MTGLVFQTERDHHERRRRRQRLDRVLGDRGADGEEPEAPDLLG